MDSVRLFSQGQIPKDLVTKMPPAKDLDDTLKFLSSRLKENYNGVIETELSIRDLQKKIEALRNELGQISGPSRKLKRSITVELEVLKPGNMDLTLSYLVRGASWQPIYDARADFDKSQVELASYAIVKQATGEDWVDANISLSTARPSIGGRMPYISPWILRPYKPPVAYGGVALKRERGLMYQSEALDAGLLDEAKMEMSKAPAAPAYSIAEEKGIAVLYRLSKKATVKSDGFEHKLPVSTQILTAKFDYSAYPRLAHNAYLGSRVTNAPGLQLLAGRVNVFLSGDFVGTSGIDNAGPGEEFDLYLGVDENVKVKREQVEGL